VIVAARAVENTGSMRDEFPGNVKELLAKRVGYRCSNPDCRQPTSGPQLEAAKTVNVGVAAHITAASPDGPRYDSSLTPDQRKSQANGIWLCQKCGKLVDNDPLRFTALHLREWRSLAEDTAIHELRFGTIIRGSSNRTGDIHVQLCDRLNALADILVDDLWRCKRGSQTYKADLRSWVQSAWRAAQELRADGVGFLSLPQEPRKEYEGFLMSIHNLRDRDDDGVWYAGFTVISHLKRVVESISRAGATAGEQCERA
jgi:hypothetical protein